MPSDWVIRAARISVRGFGREPLPPSAAAPEQGRAQSSHPPEILAVERFDRAGDGRRIHMEEFTQVFNLPPAQKYGVGLHTDFVRVLTVLDKLSGRPSHDTEEFIERFVAFILMGNTDAHLKN